MKKVVKLFAGMVATLMTGGLVYWNEKQVLFWPALIIAACAIVMLGLVLWACLF